jgi:integrase
MVRWKPRPQDYQAQGATGESSLPERPGAPPVAWGMPGQPEPYLDTIVVLALAIGARRGELLTLSWPDVDLSRGTLTFH